MDEVLLRFPLLGEKIFNSLEYKSFIRCREVNKAWKNFIDGQGFQWAQIIVKQNEALFKNDKRRIFENYMRGNSFLHIAAKSKAYEIFKIIKEYQSYKNPQNKCSETPFQVACKYRHSEIIKFLLQETSIQQLNSDDINTAFLFAYKHR